MVKVYYVDVAVPADRKKRKRHKTHAVFDGVRVFRVKKLTELEDASEIYIDALFPQIYEELMELIERNVKIFSLKYPRLLKRLKEEDKVKKSDEADAQLLSRIPRIFFRELTLREIKLLQLINEYETYSKWRVIIKRWISRHPLDFLKKCVREFRRLYECYSSKIIEEVMKDENYAAIYKTVCEELGLKNSVEVAILVVRLPLNWKLRRLKGLLGLTPHKSKNYHHRLRRHLSNLAAMIYVNNKRCGIGMKLFEGIDHMSHNKVLYTLQLRILKVLKRAWQQRQCTLAGGQ